MGSRSLLGSGLFAAIAVLAMLSWPAAGRLPPAPSAPPVSDALPEPGAGTVTANPAVTREKTPADGRSWIDSLAGGGESLTPQEDGYDVVLRGRLTVRQRPSAHPAGVEIFLTRAFLDTVIPTDAGEQDQPTPAPDGPHATTDAEGRFAFRFRPTQGELFFLIDHAGPWMDLQRVPDVPRPGRELDLGDVFVDERGGIAGRVVDALGREVREATVRAVDDPLLGTNSELAELRGLRNRAAEWFQPGGMLATGVIPRWAVHRDAFLPFPRGALRGGGRFRLTGVRPGTHDLFVTSAAGTAHLASVQVAAGRVTDLGEVRLGPAIATALRFVDERGKPWVGAGVALVHVESGLGTPAVRTNSKGQADVTVFGDCHLTFAYPGGGPWVRLGRQPIPYGDETRQRYYREQVGTVVVRRPASVSFLLVDDRGQRIEHGRVRLLVQSDEFRPVDRALPEAMQPRAQDDGSHVGRAPLPVVAVASAPSFAPAVAPIDPRRGDRWTLTMLPLHAVTVRVHDRQGRAVAGAAVRIQAHGHPEHGFVGAAWDALANDRVLAGYTDESGLLTVPVWDTWISFAADHPDYAPSPGPRLRPTPGQRIELELRASATLAGRLSFHGRPAGAGFRLRASLRPPGTHELAGSGWLAEHVAVTGDDGRFALRNLVPGLWELAPELPLLPGPSGARTIERKWKITRVSLEEGQEIWRDLEAELEPLATPQITGLVRIDGACVADALVRVREIDPHPGWWRPLTEQRIRTDAFGDFAFAGLPDRRDFELRVDVPDQGRLQLVWRQVLERQRRKADAPRRVGIDLRSGALLLTCQRDQRPFANRMLRLRQVLPAGNGACWELLTSPSGECWVERLPVGNWTLEPMHGGRTEPDEFTIRPGEVVQLTVSAILP